VRRVDKEADAKGEVRVGGLGGVGGGGEWENGGKERLGARS